MTPAKQQQLLQGTSAVARKVFEVVPIQDDWEAIQILNQLRAQTRSTIDMHVLRGCLKALKDSGLIKESSRGQYRRVDARQASPAIEEQEKPMAKPATTSIQPATPSDGDSIELFGALASELAALADQFSTSLKGLAARLEDAALAAEQSRERLAGDLEAVRKFKAALAALP